MIHFKQFKWFTILLFFVFEGECQLNGQCFIHDQYKDEDFKVEYLDGLMECLNTATYDSNELMVEDWSSVIKEYKKLDKNSKAASECKDILNQKLLQKLEVAEGNLKSIEKVYTDAEKEVKESKKIFQKKELEASIALTELQTAKDDLDILIESSKEEVDELDEIQKGQIKDAEDKVDNLNIAYNQKIIIRDTAEQNLIAAQDKFESLENSEIETDKSNLKERIKDLEELIKNIAKL